MVNFIIGPQSTIQGSVIHKHAACAHFSFSEAAFESKMLEGTTPTIRLDDIDSKTFSILVHYLYTHELDGSLYIITYSPGICEKGVHDPMVMDPVQLTKVWKLCERCLISVLQTKVMETLFYMTRFEAVGSED